LEPVHEPLAFYQECVVDVVAAAEHGLAVGHALGENYVCIVQRSPGFLAQHVNLGAGNPVAVVDHREGNPHFRGICPGGIVEDDIAPNAEGNLQMRISLCDFLGENPVEADFTGIVRQVQQLLPCFQLRAEVDINFLIQLQVEGLVQHLLQLLKAYLTLEGSKVQIVAQDGKLQAREHRIRGVFHLLPDQIQTFQDELVGKFFFFLHPVQRQAVVLQHQVSHGGVEPGRRDAFRSVQIQAHQILGKSHSLLFCAQRFNHLQISPEVAQKTLGVNGEAHQLTFSFTTTLTKSLGTSR